jgi:hypothetical protein
MDILAVINTEGQVWARQLDLSGGNVGAGEEVTGPSLFGGPDDQFVVTGGIAYIAVVTKTGAFWPHFLNPSTAPPGFALGPGLQFSGSLFGGPDAKYVLGDMGCGVYVINQAGAIWNHIVELDNNSIGAGNQLNGPTLFGAPDDKYVVSTGSSILVVNTKGEVWAHDLSSSKPNIFCPDTVSVGRKLNGPSLFGAPNDKYVVYYEGQLLVINTLGEVWARSVTSSAVGPGKKLIGPGLFGGTDDKYVIAFLWEPTD